MISLAAVQLVRATLTAVQLVPATPVAVELVRVTLAAVELVQVLQMFSTIGVRNMEEHARIQKSQRAYLT